METEFDKWQRENRGNYWCYLGRPSKESLSNIVCADLAILLPFLAYGAKAKLESKFSKPYQEVKQEQIYDVKQEIPYELVKPNE